MKKIMIPGKRIIKTAIAVFVCLVVDSIFFKTNAMYSCITAVLCMLPTREETVVKSKERVVSTLMGCLFGTAMLYIYNFFPQRRTILQIILIPVLVITVIEICLALNIKSSAGLASTVFIALATSPTRSTKNVAGYVFIRMLETIIGILAAYLVNRLIFPYIPEEIPIMENDVGEVEETEIEIL